LIAAQVRTGFAGWPVTQLREHDAAVPVVLRLDTERREDFSSLETFMLGAALTNAPVPVNEVATPVPNWSPSQIARRNGVRTLTVFVTPNRDTLPSELLTPLQQQLANLELITADEATELGTRIGKLTPPDAAAPG
jgi:multidrug efflux pump subunit AcrB